MKTYDLRMVVSISHTENYNTLTPVKFEISEVLPANTDPEKYIRSRLSEELKRSFGKLLSPLENCEESNADQNDL